MCYTLCSRDGFSLSQPSLLINVLLQIGMSDLLGKKKKEYFVEWKLGKVEGGEMDIYGD